MVSSDVWENEGMVFYEVSGAPNGSVPQNICSSGKFLLAGRFGQNNMSLEIGKLWVSEVI